ncbi:unnamed protein product [Nezara viridula]|uniref:Uncharacterized protein n=1 Tax=Nezara viridula TaxID=85310 RepID=A0A9P0DYS8_NEZVI|nr:unnamed protein product [Nezara viridula]
MYESHVNLYKSTMAPIVFAVATTDRPVLSATARPRRRFDHQMQTLVTPIATSSGVAHCLFQVDLAQRSPPQSRTLDAPRLRSAAEGLRQVLRHTYRLLNKRDWKLFNLAPEIGEHVGMSGTDLALANLLRFPSGCTPTLTSTSYLTPVLDPPRLRNVSDSVVGTHHPPHPPVAADLLRGEKDGRDAGCAERAGGARVLAEPGAAERELQRGRATSVLGPPRAGPEQPLPRGRPQQVPAAPPGGAPLAHCPQEEVTKPLNAISLNYSCLIK